MGIDDNYQLFWVNIFVNLRGIIAIAHVRILTIGKLHAFRRH